MKATEQQAAAKKFVKEWSGKGYEKGESQKFWIDLLCNVFGVQDFADFIFFEEQVKEFFVINPDLKSGSNSAKHSKLTTNFIDAYIPSTHVMIEQKSSGKNLREPIKQSNGTFLTPFQQAKNYSANLPYSKRPRWIVTCNFDEFLIYDMERPNGEPQQIFLKDLPKELYRLQFLIDTKSEHIRREEEISLKAGELVGKLYDALYKEYINPDEKSLRSLNILCVRIVFCLYAEDAGLFDTKTAFEDYIQSFKVENLRDGIYKLFKALDTKLEDHDKYDTKLKPFPYVNGGLFAYEDIEIPNFSQEIVDVIVNHCAPFDWSEISPTIFGAVFESTLNPETRRKGGMHYTSIENIHKVIDPLFLNDIKSEFSEICETKTAKIRNDKLEAFQKKIGALKFLDPACGSGNFLTETYASLRKIENECIKLRLGKESALDVFGEEFKPQVNIDQFYGIEINDFAVTVAKTALWIAECQMMEDTSKILNRNLNFLPLKNHATIVEGNALRMDWEYLSEEPHLDLLYADKLKYYIVPEDFDKDSLHDASAKYEAPSELHVATKQVEQGNLEPQKIEKVRYDYIMGNPPFVGARYMSKPQKDDLLSVFGKKWQGVGDLDFVCAWYKKASPLLQNGHTKAAFVSTNSIVQGGSVSNLWKPLFEKDNLHIDFAYRTFRWASESSSLAHVHCVIIGCSIEESTTSKHIYNSDGSVTVAKNINGYLLDAPNTFIEMRSKPICDVPQICLGGQPIDDGNLILTAEEKEKIVKKDPQVAKFIRRYMMGKDFIDRKPRYCLWLQGANPAEFRKSHEIMKRIEKVREFRLASDRSSTLRAAEMPYLFGAPFECESDYIAIPKVSSEKRQYIPIDFLSHEIIPGDNLFVMQRASDYHLGVLASKVHNAWMRMVCGRLEMRYRYSNTIVYNNFPWCNPSETQKTKIEATAQTILDVREKYPNASLADLYDDLTMPPDLRKAHTENDRAVMEAYGFDLKMAEDEIVAELFKMYEKLAKSI